jgi:hypothetical protein
MDVSPVLARTLPQERNGLCGSSPSCSRPHNSAASGRENKLQNETRRTYQNKSCERQEVDDEIEPQSVHKFPCLPNLYLLAQWITATIIPLELIGPYDRRHTDLRLKARKIIFI